MKRIIAFILFVLAFFGNVRAEEICISVAMPNQSMLDNNTKSILKSKLLNIVTNEGVASMECSAMVMVPEVSVVNSELVEGGMRNITALELSIAVSVRNIITNAVFNSLTISVRGNGYSKQEAIRSAINTIKESDFTQFATSSRKKIIDYYNANTTALIAKAKTLASQQEYDEALALLSTYPESLSGFSKVSAAIHEIFHQAQTQYCSQILLSARSAYANRDFETAAALASQIDATSSCGNEAKALLSSIKSSTDAEYNNQINLERQAIASKERIATATIHAARDIATAYFKRQTQYVFWW
jgi:hypothetical protein